MTRAPLLPYDDALRLPAASRRVVPPEFGDGNGHLNVRHYLGILDDAEWELFDDFGAGHAASARGEGGMFALEQHLTYRHEVMVGDEVGVHVRFVERTAKVLHVVSYLLNHSRRETSACLEAVEAYVDYATRRTTPFPEHGAAVLDRLVAEHAGLPTDHLGGAISLR